VVVFFSEQSVNGLTNIICGRHCARALEKTSEQQSYHLQLGAELAAPDGGTVNNLTSIDFPVLGIPKERCAELLEQGCG
jgi:hypothetical protein